MVITFIKRKRDHYSPVMSVIIRRMYVIIIIVSTCNNSYIIQRRIGPNDDKSKTTMTDRKNVMLACKSRLTIKKKNNRSPQSRVYSADTRIILCALCNDILLLLWPQQ